MASSSSGCAFFLFFFFYCSLFFISQSQTTPLAGLLINCGSSRSIVSNGLTWNPDNPYISMGSSASLKPPDSDPLFSTLRYFPENSARKSCFVLPVVRNVRYLVRTAYFYGGFDGGTVPPVFDQIVEGTFWSTVNTTEDYALNRPSFYELFLAATGKKISVCVARNNETISSPFISAIELIRLKDSVYNSTDFGKHALSTVARHAFGYGGKTIRFPDDEFDRFWEQFTDANLGINTTADVSVFGFWNIPPSKVFDTALTAKEGKIMELQWPSIALRNSNYYIALYFRHHQVPGSPPWRVFTVSVNNVEFYQNLNVTHGGEVVFATQWPLVNFTKILLAASTQSAIGPVINAGELLEIVNLGGRTLTRDVIALESLKKGMLNPPPDWNGDPCLPRENSWTGVTCYEGSRVRVTLLNLTGMGISGSLSPLMTRLTALNEIWLGHNNFSGTIPDLSPLKRLTILHLENNQLNGTIPPTLGMIQSLCELYLQNNNLTGEIPASLRKQGLHLQTSPGNPLLK